MHTGVFGYSNYGYAVKKQQIAYLEPRNSFDFEKKKSKNRPYLGGFIGGVTGEFRYLAFGL